MAKYVRAFVLPQVVQVHEAFIDAEEKAQRLGLTATAGLIRDAHAGFNRSLDQLAAVTASNATKRIKFHLARTSRRPDTGVKPHLRDNIRSAPIRVPGPLAAGAVGVADLGQLEKVVNPFDRKGVPYWIVQEEGTAKNVGRTIRGFFHDTGYSGSGTRPESGRTGTKAAQPLFKPGYDSRGNGTGVKGGVGGKGVIRQPIPARHFVEKGANDARVVWKSELRTVQRVSLAELALALGAAKPTPRLGRGRRRR